MSDFNENDIENEGNQQLNNSEIEHSVEKVQSSSVNEMPLDDVKKEVPLSAVTDERRNFTFSDFSSSNRTYDGITFSKLTEEYREDSNRKSIRKSGFFKIFIAVLVISFIFSFAEKSSKRDLPTFDKNVFHFKTSSTKATELPDHDYIARLYITGVIEDGNKTYNQAWLLNTIEKLKSDDRNRGIILVIDSPGGGVYQADEVYFALLDYKKTTEKPVWTYMKTLAASGGYYISCASDKIYANRNTMTGSIGVIAGSAVDLTGLMDRYGIKMKTFTAGKNKNMLNYNSPVTEEQEEIMQTLADECYEQFVGVVADGRKMSYSDVKKLADGRVYTAKQALQHKLIDRISNFDECISEMRNQCFDCTDIPCEDFFYHEEFSFYDILSSKSLKTNGDLPSVLTEKLEKKIPYPAFYYEK